MPTTNFGIPDFVIEGFSILFGLEISRQRAILEELKNRGKGEHPLDTIGEISSNLGLSEDEQNQSIAPIIQAIISFLKALSKYAEEENELITSLVKVLDARLEVDNLNQKVRDLVIDLKGTTLTLKAYDLAYNRSRVLTETRIITDIRPIFTDDDECTIQGSLIVHNLKLLFREDGETKEHYFAIDGGDLNNLLRQIKRAQKKEVLLDDQLKINGITRIKLR